MSGQSPVYVNWLFILSPNINTIRKPIARIDYIGLRHHSIEEIYVYKKAFIYIYLHSLAAGFLLDD